MNEVQLKFYDLLIEATRLALATEGAPPTAGHVTPIVNAVEGLVAEVRRLQGVVEEMQQAIDRMGDCIEPEEGYEVRRLRAALAVYADHEHWSHHDGEEGYDWWIADGWDWVWYGDPHDEPWGTAEEALNGTTGPAR